MEAPMIVEKYQDFKKDSLISIRPYVDENRDNMGLQKANQVVFEGVCHEEQLACIEANGIIRYVTGLNEFAPEIKALPREEQEAAIMQIRETVAQLEKEMASNFIEPTDKDFWNKVKLLRSDNHVFWSKIYIRCGNDPVFLEPTKDPFDLIKIKAIEAGGFSTIAKSYEDARNRNIKFYLDRYQETVSLKTEVKKIRNKALAELQKLFDKNVNKLLYVCKVVDGNSMQYKKSTPLDVMYDNMDSYINGASVDKDKRKTASHFLSIAELDMETLKLRAMIKDANYVKAIATKSDGHIYHLKSNSLIGKNPSDILEYLKNPLNEDVLNDIMKIVEKHWNS